MVNRHRASSFSKKVVDGQALAQTGTVMMVASGAVFLSAPAEAYLDPGTGSMILQGIVAGIAAAFAYAGMYWQRIKDFFSRRRKDTDAEKTTDDET